MLRALRKARSNMLDYGPFYVLYKLKRLRSQVAYLLGLMNSIKTEIINGGSGSVVIRDTPTDPEPAPDAPAVNAILVFRDSSPWKVWDAANGVWMNE